MNSLKKIYCKLKYGKSVIIVSGLPRSGTSMMMQMLEAGGLVTVTDKIREANQENPKGYYELEQVKELDKSDEKFWMKEHKGKVVKVISFLLRYLPMNLNYKVIFIQRDIEEVLKSQNKMLKNCGEKDELVGDEKMRKNYKDHLWRVKYLLKHTANFDVLYINHNDILSSPIEQAKRINEFFNNHLNADSMAGIVDRALYRNRA